jgi:hypothetical protein
MDKMDPTNTVRLVQRTTGHEPTLKHRCKPARITDVSATEVSGQICIPAAFTLVTTPNSQIIAV